MKKKNFYQILDDFVAELHKDGTVGKWKVEKKLKQAKKTLRKAARKTNEEKRKAA